MASRTFVALNVAVLSLCALLPLACGETSSEFGDGSSGKPGEDGGGGILGDDAGSIKFACLPDKKNSEIPDNGCDDDDDGIKDNKLPTCDTGLSGNIAEDFAKAIGLCDRADGPKGYGLVSATFTRGFGTAQSPQAEQHNILPKFGNIVKPQEGASLAVLSTGYATEFNGAAGEAFGGQKSEVGAPNGVKTYGKDWYDYRDGDPNGAGNGKLPPGFPKAAEGCLQAKATNDVINLKLTIKAPPNAAGFKFDFNFFSGEWPAYICSPFNDGFIAYLTAQGFNGGAGDNISFDSRKNPVSVNNGFFDRCTAGVQTGCGQGGEPGTSQCPGGDLELGGTGFGLTGTWCSVYDKKKTNSSVNGGATGWLTSQAPVKAGETFTLEFMIWDTGDAVLDSSVLIDNFRWASGNIQTETSRPPVR
jgi:hypothetical protein